MTGHYTDKCYGILSNAVHVDTSLDTPVYQTAYINNQSITPYMTILTPFSHSQFYNNSLTAKTSAAVSHTKLPFVLSHVNL